MVQKNSYQSLRRYNGSICNLKKREFTTINKYNADSGLYGQYIYLWSNGYTESTLKDQNKGNFTLLLTDRKGCQKEKSFELIPPPIPTAGWIETSAVLCTGNVKPLDGGEFTAYEWRRNDQLVSIDRFYTLSESGTYTLQITTDLGCIATDTFNLDISDHPLDAVLLLQDSAYVSELVEAIDVTWPVPDSINWFFDKSVVLDTSNEWSQQFFVEEEGLVNVTLRAWYGGCFSDSAKTITIYNNEGGLQEKQFEASPLILGFKVYPNPNDGNFNIGIKLSREADISLKLFGLQNNSIIHAKDYKGLGHYEISYQLRNLITGVYIIILSAEREQQSLKIVID